MTGPGTGALSSFAYDLEPTRGVKTVAGLGDFLFVTSNTMNAMPDVIRKKVMMNRRHVENVVSPSKFKITGATGHPLTGNTGAKLCYAALGLDTYLTDLPVAYTLLATTGGVTKLHTVAAVVPGAWTKFGTGATEQLRQLYIDPAGSTGDYLVKALNTTNSTSPTGTAHQVAQHKISPIPSDSVSPVPFSLPTLTVELNEGAQWAASLRGCYVGKYNLKGGKEEVEVTETLMGTEMPDFLAIGASTPFAPDANALADIRRPFSINDGFVVVPNDGLGGGTSLLQPLLELEDWEFDFDNGMIESAFWDEGQVYKCFPGEQKLGFKYSYAIAAGRPDIIEDFLTQVDEKSVQAGVSLLKNIGTPSVKSWYAFGLYIPSTLITKADVSRTTNDLLKMTVETDVLAQAADVADIFIVNAHLSAYVLPGS